MHHHDVTYSSCCTGDLKSVFSTVLLFQSVEKEFSDEKESNSCSTLEVVKFVTRAPPHTTTALWTLWLFPLGERGSLWFLYEANHLTLTVIDAQCDFLTILVVSREGPSVDM